MQLSAISHHSTARDCYALGKGQFLIRLRTGKGDIQSVTIHYQDKYLPLSIQDTRRTAPMQRIASDHTLDYWEVVLSCDVVCLRYWFEIQDNSGRVMFYSNYRFSEEEFSDIDDMFNLPQNLREEEQFLVPQWAKNKIVYQVFPSRFAASQPVPDAQWYKAPISFRDNLHGDLRGIINHLDHLKELGVDILYMTPIFFSRSCHKYDTIDYYTIDPEFGTKEDLKELVETAHAMGMKVILDGVFNHTSQEFFAFADIKEKQWDSEYIDWYFIEGFPLKSAWGTKPNFKCFAYFGGMPKLNVKNPQVSRYILDVALYWLRECHIDGWRLDVSDEISHRFWRRFREEIKAEFPEALIIGEIWYHAEDFLQGDEWDTVMNYPFYHALLRLLRGECKVSDFAMDLDFQRGQLHSEVTSLLWNLIGSHDTPRILHRCGGDKRKQKLAAALQLLLPGMPMIYYGDEYAMEGGQDPDCRRGMLWDPKHQDGDMYAHYRSLIRVRKDFPGLLDKTGTSTADDASGILIRKGAEITAVFHCKDGQVKLEEYKGKTNLLTGTVFDGILGDFETAVFSD